MKYAMIAAALAGVAAAQSQCLSSAEAIPSCGQSCLTAAGSSYGCVYTDFACQCSHQSQINNAALTSCVLSACTDAQTALAVSSSALALCSCVSANPGSGSGSGGSSAATTSAAVPATTAAMSSKPTAGSGSGSGSGSMSQFTGAAAYTAGSIGGLFAGVLGLIAAL